MCERPRCASDRCRASISYILSRQFPTWVPQSIPQDTPHLQHPPCNWKLMNHPFTMAFPAFPGGQGLPAWQSWASGFTCAERMWPIQEEEQVWINLEHKEAEESLQPGGNQLPVLG